MPPPSPPLDTENSILRTIATAASLTPVQRRMANFVQDNMFRAATMSIDEFAVAAGASAATANRFARALGFDGYPSFRGALVRGYEANLAPVERLRRAQNSAQASAPGRDGLLDASLAQSVNNIETTRLALDPAACTTIVDAMLGARRVHVLGYGASAFLAGLTEHGFTPYCPDIQSLALLGGPSHAARRLSSAGREDVLLSIGFPRYSADTVTLTRYAAKRGVRIFALTDCPVSPLAALAQVSLFIRSTRQLAANSDAAVLTVIEALCDLAAHRSHDAVRAATDLTESVLPWLVQQPVPESARATSAAASETNRRAAGSRIAPRRQPPGVTK
ncbi:MurR/RpiR family transcriptional regulator [Robbsia sp. Bb-Pol-6]|uniref:MurR/RpiR family transcriptional regulator n=1 Tax=Robbsia betulipollinis TaxID=2981849 RepID=A0ABT3ZH47_9BURK|nr:MurR/RpiR family transcriptional regulator [Robbsia betulipollinis]MCY0385843.1 MurR/RpiR family transcriptional regulator [Robbsia betulipollinis]